MPRQPPVPHQSRAAFPPLDKPGRHKVDRDNMVSPRLPLGHSWARKPPPFWRAELPLPSSLQQLSSQLFAALWFSERPFVLPWCAYVVLHPSRQSAERERHSPDHQSTRCSWPFALPHPGTPPSPGHWRPSLFSSLHLPGPCL